MLESRTLETQTNSDFAHRPPDPECGVGMSRWTVCLLFLLIPGWAAYRIAADSQIERGPWSGAVTPTSAVVKVKLSHSDQVAMLLVDTEPAFHHPRRFGPVLSDTNQANVVGFALHGLKPDTAYHYAVEVGGQLESEKAGRFRTFPGQPASFRFAFASCGRTGSTNASYDQIRCHDPLFFLCTGDLHYEDVKTNVVAKFWQAYDKVLASPVQAELYRQIPLTYVWDDHDFCGNDSDSHAIGRAAAKSAYRTYIAHYPLAFPDAEGPIAQSFEVGRAKFLMTDLRSQRDPASLHEGPTKTMLGVAQKAWLKRELIAANGRYPLIFWVSSVPWNGMPHTNQYWPVTTNMFGYLHHTRLDYTWTTNHPPHRPAGIDSWAAYATERRELADFIKANRIRGLIVLHGDMHALGADNGSNTDFATHGGAPIPLFAAAPLDRDGSLKGGPYSAGVYKPSKGEGCFGLVDVEDLGRELLVHFSGRTSEDREVIHLDVRVPAR